MPKPKPPTASPSPARRSSGNATKPVQMRLDAVTLADIDAIAAHHGLRSRSDAVRIAARALAQSLVQGAEKKIGEIGGFRG